MEYFVLVSTLISLVAGFLFFADKIVPFDIVAKSILVIFTMIVIIGANIFVVIMIIYDVFVRRKKEKKREKNKKREREEIRKKEKRRLEYEKIHGLINEEEEAIKKESIEEYDFRIFDEPSESEEDNLTTINEILEDLISIQRVKKKIFLVKKRSKKYSIRIVHEANKLSKRASTSNMKRLSTIVDLEKLETSMTEDKTNLEYRKSTFSKAKKLIRASKKEEDEQKEVQSLEPLELEDTE